MVATGTTVLLGVPTMCIALCDAARSAPALPPLRLAHVGGAPVPVEVTREFEETFGADVYEGYGLTEISGIATTYRTGELRKPGSVGRPLGDTELKIVTLDGDVVAAGEVGEIRFRGSSVIPGYWGGAEVSPDGWLATGDLGYVDDDGYLFIVDRLKDMIIRNGYNVYPREVEEVLYEHPDVLEAAVIGIPDPRLGDEVVALVKPRPGAVCDPAEIQQWVRERVAAYKYPRHVVVVDSLPTGPTGKILKREIDREQLARDLLPSTACRRCPAARASARRAPRRASGRPGDRWPRRPRPPRARASPARTRERGGRAPSSTPRGCGRPLRAGWWRNARSRRARRPRIPRRSPHGSRGRRRSRRGCPSSGRALRTGRRGGRPRRPAAPGGPGR